MYWTGLCWLHTDSICCAMLCCAVMRLVVVGCQRTLSQFECAQTYTYYTYCNIDVC